MIYRPGIYNLQTRTSTFQDQEMLPERVNLRYLKKLKIKTTAHVQNIWWYTNLICRSDVQFTDQKITA